MQALKEKNYAALNNKDDSLKLNSSQKWETNHQKIEACLQNLLKQGKRPTQDEIAETVGLSRFTVGKHFKRRSISKATGNAEKIIRLLKPQMDMEICRLALQGDPRAIKQFYKLIATPKKAQKAKNNIINQQTNFIQYNGVVIKAKDLQNLAPEKQTHLENLLKEIKANHTKLLPQG